MNVNRKFDRFKQWAGERMGGEVKTSLSDDFKAMETEMNVRHEGEKHDAQYRWTLFVSNSLTHALSRS